MPRPKHLCQQCHQHTMNGPRKATMLVSSYFMTDRPYCTQCWRKISRNPYMTWREIRKRKEVGGE